MSSSKGKTVFLSKNRNSLYKVHDPRGLRAFGVDDGNWQVVAPHTNMFAWPGRAPEVAGNVNCKQFLLIDADIHGGVKEVLREPGSAKPFPIEIATIPMGPRGVRK